jgi:penicillin-binding protein 1A
LQTLLPAGLQARWQARLQERWQAHRAGKSRGFVVLSAVLLGAAALLVVALVWLVLSAIWYAKDLPPLDKATTYRPTQHLQVLTSDGVEIAQFGTERRLFVPIAQMPKRLQASVLAVEDTQFYDHWGISLRGLTRAAWANLSGGVPQGASTITQQVARTFFLSSRRTAERKIKEAMLAVQLEHKLGKDQILELYLNQIYLGQRAYGFAAAAQVYFGKNLPDLTIAETAMLAGMPQNPIHADPLANPQRAAKRQQWVLQRMLVTGVITEAERQQALTEKLRLRATKVADISAQHVAEMARQAVVQKLGEKAYTEGIRVTTSIRSEDQRVAHAALRRALMAHERKQAWRGPEEQETLPDDAEKAERAAALALKDQADDPDLRVAIVMAASAKEVTLKLATGQNIVVKSDSLKWLQGALSPQAPAALALRRGAIVRVLQSNQTKKRDKTSETITTWSITQWPQADAAFVAMDPSTGRVRALVGGFDFSRQQFNHVTAAARQPGSSFKPFLYSAAFEHRVMPETLVEDAPLTQTDGSPIAWDPQNSDGRFDGDMTVREGLVRSKNLISARLLQHLGLTHARNWIARFGFDMAQQPSDLTFALGSGSVTPLQMAVGYAVFANGGHRVTPVVIERIVNAQGQVLFEAPPAKPLTESDRVIPARNVFLVNSLLADVTRRGTASKAQATLRRGDLYGKTGTTNDSVDAWFGGFAPGAVAVAWMGYDEPRSLGEGETGGGLALPIWIDSMTHMLKGVPVKSLSNYLPPSGIASVGTEWRYAEYANGGALHRVGKPSPAAEAAAAAKAAAAEESASAAAR